MPCRLGGLGLVSPMTLCAQYESSVAITASLSRRVVDRVSDIGNSLIGIKREKAKRKKEVRHSQAESARRISNDASDALRHTIVLAREPGASSWLTCRPLKKYGFSLSKAEFMDGLCLRYGWMPPRLPTHCSCGRNNGIDHALSCPLGGFTIIHHNEIRDVTASLLQETCHNVSIEPLLQPLTGERMRYRSAIVEEHARLDVAVSGLWGSHFERTFLDIRVFNPHARSNRSAPHTTVYRRHEKEKRRCYEERVREVEHATFMPVVLSASGGMGRAAASLYRRIALLLPRNILHQMPSLICPVAIMHHVFAGFTGSFP